jgi:hypothetical protein
MKYKWPKNKKKEKRKHSVSLLTREMQIKTLTEISNQNGHHQENKE